MAKVSSDSAFFGASGKMGGVTFVTNSGGTYIRKASANTSNSADQTHCRNKFLIPPLIAFNRPRLQRGCSEVCDCIAILHQLSDLSTTESIVSFHYLFFVSRRFTDIWPHPRPFSKGEGSSAFRVRWFYANFGNEDKAASSPAFATRVQRGLRLYRYSPPTF